MTSRWPKIKTLGLKGNIMQKLTQLKDVATCCRTSAKMLELADQDNKRFSELNCKQAELLRECARMLDEWCELPLILA